MLFKKKKDKIDRMNVEEKENKTFFDYAVLIFINTFLILIVVALWEILPRIGVIKQSLLPPISKIFMEWGKLLSQSKLLLDACDSIKRAVLGYGLSMVIGIPLGVLIGYFKLISRLVSPIVHICRQIPALSLFPIFILFFGIGEASKIAIVFWVSVWPILLNTVNGVKHADLLLIKAAKSMGADNITVLRTVVLPSSIPSMMTGIRLGAGSAIVALVSAEMIGAKSGLGYMIINSQYNFQIPQMYVAILSIAVIGIIINQILVSIEKHLTFWAQTVDDM